MGTNKIEALLVYYWERSDHMNKKSLPNGNHMQFTFIYFIFIVTENTTFDLQLILRYIQASDLVTPIIK